MSDPIDYSDRIAHIQTCLIVLNDFEPSGEWTEHKLLKKWQKSTYSLTRKEFATLERFLDRERQRVTAPKPIVYEQLSLLPRSPYAP